MSPRLKVLSVASEIFPLIKTGGLADVVGALPGALARYGVDVVSLLPLYASIRDKLTLAKTVHLFDRFFGGPARILSARADGLDLFLLDAPHLFDRQGNPYQTSTGREWPDNGLRFAALARAAALIGKGLVPGYQPHIVHCHDWQAGLAPAYLTYDGGPRPKTVMTVHNLAFQGKYPYDTLAQIGLPARSFVYDGVEYFGSIGYLKAGLQFADRITTVSPNYAAEILTPEAGMGLDGLLRARAEVLSGIINGIDTQVWNPREDKALAAPFSLRDVGPRGANKAALQERMGLRADPDALLYGVVTRLSWQKGLDLLLQALPALTASGAQLAVLGAGDADLEAGFRTAAASHPGRIACYFGYDESLAHLIQGGADALLVPSRFEPCGLTQLCALRYGAVPVVSRVGGLADTVIDANEMALNSGVATGIVFQPVTVDGLTAALNRTAALFSRPEEWRRVQANGMKCDVSWAGPARRYADLYLSLLGHETV